MELTACERNALMELANAGVGRAASNLCQMVAEPIHLSVPAVELLSYTQAVLELGKREKSNLVAVRQTFEGAFSGHALLLLPETKSLELMRAVLGTLPTLEEIADLEHEALAEVGNVVLNATLATIARSLRHTLHISLPTVLRGNNSTILTVPGEAHGADSQVLFLYIDFTVGSRDIRGCIAVLMSHPSLAELKRLTGAFIERAGGGTLAA